jgi:prolyl oligopeptidase
MAPRSVIPSWDMMRFHKLLVGKYWIDDYGDPDKEKDQRYLLKYSPYHNLKEKGSIQKQ